MPSSLTSPSQPSAVIACGGTGGHLFPGLAIGEELLLAGCSVTLLISPKEVDQQAVKTVSGMRIETLPAVGLTRGKILGFISGFYKSYRASQKLFAEIRPGAVLAMGGFTGAPPVLAGRNMGAKTFLHEANSIPGRANRWLARRVDHSFVYFPGAAQRLRGCQAEVAGMPVRAQFLETIDPVSARMALGLKPDQPTLLVMGGSQGARGINDLAVAALPAFEKAGVQVLHLTGAFDFDRIQAAYKASGCHAVVKSFLSEMDLALGAATVAISRAGASSSAELAAMRLPAILIPYPTAADNHQYFNALAMAQSGAARMIEQKNATAEQLAALTLELIRNPEARTSMVQALDKWHYPDAAGTVARKILETITGACSEGGAR